MSAMTSNKMTTAKPITRMSFSVFPVNVKSLAWRRNVRKWKGSGVKEGIRKGGSEEGMKGGMEGEEEEWQEGGKWETGKREG